MRNTFLYIGLLIVLVGIGYQGYNLIGQHSELRERANELSAQATSLRDNQAMLEADLEYYRHPENSLKELQAQSHYRRPGEALYIIVPPEPEH
jgi:cell division protein FtsB